MKTIVRFTVGAASFAAPVERISEVRSAGDLTPLPEPREGVAGLILRAGATISVLSMFGATGRHVVVIDADALTFGLLVEEVTGVQQIDDAAIRPPPAGQHRALVEGVVTDGDELVLLLDVGALAARLS